MAEQTAVSGSVAEFGDRKQEITDECIEKTDAVPGSSSDYSFRNEQYDFGSF